MLGEHLWDYAVAMNATLCFMLLTRTVHPPAGADPLIVLHAHADFGALLQTIGLGVLALAVVAALWSRLIPGIVRYSLTWLEPSPPTPFWESWDN
jgi:CBS-domain-containing membrane protein